MAKKAKNSRFIRKTKIFLRRRVKKIIREWIKIVFQWRTIERAKVLLEITAILIAAFWTYSVFFSTESDLLLPRRSIKAEINWFNQKKDECQAEFKVDFQNIGKKNLEIDRVLVRGWYLRETASLSETEGIKHLDPMKMLIHPQILYYDDEDLRGIYKPEEQNTKGFLFAVKKIPDKQILLKVDIWQKDDLDRASNIGTWSYYSWDTICGTTIEEETEKKENKLKPDDPQIETEK